MSNETPKKILEKSPMSGIAVPIAIVLLGALIVFGITKMLSSGKDYKDLVGELQSKTFGNRWVAAFELSKYIASKKIPDQDRPWLLKELTKVYKNTIDERTKLFVVRAVAALEDSNSLEILSEALRTGNNEIKFHATVALVQLKNLEGFDWSPVLGNAKSGDAGLKQVSLLCLAQKSVQEAESIILGNLSNEDEIIRYAAAASLVYYKNPKSLGVLSKLMSLNSVGQQETGKGLRIEAMQYNALVAIEKNSWLEAMSLVEEAAVKQENIKISTKARQILNLLKK